MNGLSARKNKKTTEPKTNRKQKRRVTIMRLRRAVWLVVLHLTMILVLFNVNTNAAQTVVDHSPSVDGSAVTAQPTPAPLPPVPPVPAPPAPSPPTPPAPPAIFSMWSRAEAAPLTWGERVGRVLDEGWEDSSVIHFLLARCRLIF